MGMTLSEKIIARASARERVQPGEIVTCEVDLAMMHDSSGPRRQAPKLAELGANVMVNGLGYQQQITSAVKTIQSAGDGQVT